MYDELHLPNVAKSQIGFGTANCIKINTFLGILG